MKVGDRVRHDAAAATVVHRMDKHFVEISYDEPQPRTNIYGRPYMTDCCAIHVELLTPEMQDLLPGLEP